MNLRRHLSNDQLTIAGARTCHELFYFSFRQVDSSEASGIIPFRNKGDFVNPDRHCGIFDQEEVGFELATTYNSTASLCFHSSDDIFSKAKAVPSILSAVVKTSTSIFIGVRQPASFRMHLITMSNVNRNEYEHDSWNIHSLTSYIALTIAIRRLNIMDGWCKVGEHFSNNRCWFLATA